MRVRPLHLTHETHFKTIVSGFNNITYKHTHKAAAPSTIKSQTWFSEPPSGEEPTEQA